MTSASTSDLLDAASREFTWFLYDLDISANEFLFVRTDREDVARQTFLDFRWKPHAGEICRLPVDPVVETLRRNEARPRLNFIWHTSFCCSTLIAKLLDYPGRNLSLREPMALISLADAIRARVLENKKLARPAMDAVFRLLAKRDDARSQVTVKPSNLANRLARETNALVEGKSLFLYSDLPSFIVSIVNGGPQYRDFARIVFEKVAGDLGMPLRWQPAELNTMPPLKLACLAWHLQIAELRRSWPGDARAASLDCDAFLNDPAGTLEKLDAFLELGLGSEQIEGAVGGPLLTRHAKSPEHRFSPQAREEQAREIRRRLGTRLDHLVEWSYQEFPETSHTAPLPNPLVAIPPR